MARYQLSTRKQKEAACLFCHGWYIYGQPSCCCLLRLLPTFLDRAVLLAEQVLELQTAMRQMLQAPVVCPRVEAQNPCLQTAYITH